jgi:hypothetical protein
MRFALMLIPWKGMILANWKILAFEMYWGWENTCKPTPIINLGDGMECVSHHTSPV